MIKPVEKPVEYSEPVTDASFDEDFTPEQLDLLHHPSYQEPGGGVNTRRRRRRQPTNIVLKDEAPSVNKGRNGGDGNKDLDYNNETEGDSRRERGQRHVRREEAPMEKVSVEMTPAEQDVYALMGISPLIRLDREFKDPKSVLVSVKLPTDSKPRVSQGTIELPKVTIPDTTDSPNSDNEEKTTEDIKEQDSETANAKPVIRRRRRRSSAKETDE